MSRNTITITDQDSGAKVRTALGKTYYVVNARVLSFNFKTQVHEPTPVARVDRRTDSAVAAQQELRKSAFNTVYRIQPNDQGKLIAMPLTETQVANLALREKRDKSASKREVGRSIWSF